MENALQIGGQSEETAKTILEAIVENFMITGILGDRFQAEVFLKVYDENSVQSLLQYLLPNN